MIPPALKNDNNICGFFQADHYPLSLFCVNFRSFQSTTQFLAKSLVSDEGIQTHNHESPSITSRSVDNHLYAPQ